MAANVRLMESYALPIFRLGHIPVLGEWLALPLVHLAGSQQIGDEAFNEIFHPIAERLCQFMPTLKTFHLHIKNK